MRTSHPEESQLMFLVFDLRIRTVFLAYLMRAFGSHWPTSATARPAPLY